MNQKRRGASLGLINEFQLIVRRYARAQEPNIELPTDMLIQIAEALDWVSRPGRPQKTRLEKITQSIVLSKGRARIEELVQKGESRRAALDRVARDMQSKLSLGLALSTIRDRLQRRKKRRRPR